jgi:hypothetical protein
MGRAALSLLLCATALCATLHPASCTDSGMCTSPEVPCGAPEAAPACAAPTAGSNGSEACAAPVVEQPSASASDTPPPCPKLVDYPGGRAAIDISTMDPVTECDRQLLTEVLAFDEGRQAAGVAEEGAPAAPPTDATASEPIDPGTAHTELSLHPLVYFYIAYHVLGDCGRGGGGGGGDGGRCSLQPPTVFSNSNPT